MSVLYSSIWYGWAEVADVAFGLVPLAEMPAGSPGTGRFDPFQAVMVR